MKSIPMQWRHFFTVLVLMALAVAARIKVTMLDFNSLLTYYLADDAFYYYKIAENIFNWHRITYDGEQLSNGFHPLWLALITLFYTPLNDGLDFVYRVQWVMFFISILTVIALYFTLLRLRASWFVSAIVTAVFCVHSTFVDMQMNGLETSLNTLVLLLLLNVFLKVYLESLSSYWHYAWLGFIAAAAFLTRTDNAITLLLLFTLLAWEHRKHFIVLMPRFLLAGSIALLIAAPWLLWNQINFGSMIQSSGKVETILWGEPVFSWGDKLYRLIFTPMRLYDNLQDFAKLFISPVGNMAWMSALFLGSWLLLMLLMLRRKHSPSMRALACFCIAVMAVFCYHAGFRSFVRTWYHIPVGLVALLSVAGLGIWLESVTKFSRFLLLLWLASVLWLHSPTKLPGAATEQSAHRVVADWINSETPPNAVVGSMNSGVLGYLAHRKVINLDGVVDYRSMQAHWQKNRHAYIHERGIHFLVDNDGALVLFCSENPLHTCETVLTFGNKFRPSKVVKIVNK
jgi:hypothetical protein